MITPGGTRLVVLLASLGALRIAALALGQGRQALLLLGLAHLASVLLPLELTLHQVRVTLGQEIEGHQHERRVRGLQELLVHQPAGQHSRQCQPPLLAAVPLHDANDDGGGKGAASDGGGRQNEQATTTTAKEGRPRGSQAGVEGAAAREQPSNADGCGAAKRRSIFSAAYLPGPIPWDNCAPSLTPLGKSGNSDGSTRNFRRVACSENLAFRERGEPAHTSITLVCPISVGQ